MLNLQQEPSCFLAFFILWVNGMKPNMSVTRGSYSWWRGPKNNTLKSGPGEKALKYTLRDLQ